MHAGFRPVDWISINLSLPFVFHQAEIEAYTSSLDVRLYPAVGVAIFPQRFFGIVIDSQVDAWIAGSASGKLLWFALGVRLRLPGALVAEAAGRLSPWMAGGIGLVARLVWTPDFW